MKNGLIAARILLGLIYFVFGLNGFFNFIPRPPLPESALSLMSAMVGSGYLFVLVKLTETLGGFLLLAGFWIPFALFILAPITLNIFLFHAFLAPQGMLLQVVMVALHSFIAWCYRDSFRPLLAQRPKPRF